MQQKRFEKRIVVCCTVGKETIQNLTNFCTESKCLDLSPSVTRNVRLEPFGKNEISNFKVLYTPLALAKRT